MCGCVMRTKSKEIFIKNEPTACGWGGGAGGWGGGGGAYKKSSQKLDEKVCFGDDVNEI